MIEPRKTLCFVASFKVYSAWSDPKPYLPQLMHLNGSHTEMYFVMIQIILSMFFTLLYLIPE